MSPCKFRDGVTPLRLLLEEVVLADGVMLLLPRT